MKKLILTCSLLGVLDGIPHNTHTMDISGPLFQAALTGGMVSAGITTLGAYLYCAGKDTKKFVGGQLAILAGLGTGVLTNMILKNPATHIHPFALFIAVIATAGAWVGAESCLPYRVTELQKIGKIITKYVGIAGLLLSLGCGGAGLYAQLYGC